MTHTLLKLEENLQDYSGVIFINVFNKYLFGIDWMEGTALGAKDTVVSNDKLISGSLHFRI